MTGKPERLKRIARLRVIEHKIAKIKLASAEAALANLARIDCRLSSLKSGLSAPSGATTGLAMHARCEMATRLDSARQAIVEPVADAKRFRQRKQVERTVAYRMEESSEKLRAKAEVASLASRERRTAANTPTRRLTRHLEDL
jgi:hypothetical protein